MAAPLAGVMQNSSFNFKLRVFLTKLSNPKSATKWSLSVSDSGVERIDRTTFRTLTLTSWTGKNAAEGTVENFEDVTAISEVRVRPNLSIFDVLCRYFCLLVAIDQIVMRLMRTASCRGPWGFVLVIDYLLETGVPATSREIVIEQAHRQLADLGSWSNIFPGLRSKIQQPRSIPMMTSLYKSKLCITI